MLRSGLFGDSAQEAAFNMGFVRTYDPGVNTYRIALDGKSEGIARPIMSGAYKPYPVGTRVACIKFATSSWLILGEVASSRAPTKERESPAGAVYQKDLELRRALHDRYSIDMADFGEYVIDPPLEGDVVMQNRDDPRSYHQIYENGDILSLASNFCFRLLSRVKSLAVTWAKDCWQIFAGYSFKVQTDDKTKQATTTISINSDPSDEADRDVDIVAGAVSNGNRPTKNVSVETKGQTISEGVWALLGTHALLEVDNQAKEVRLSKVAIQAGQDTFGKDAQFRMNENQIGLVWGDNKVVLSDSMLVLKRKGRSILMDDKRISLTWASDKFIALTDKGVQIAGMLEIVGGQLKFNSQSPMASSLVVDGESIQVPEGTDGVPNLTYQVSGDKLDISGSGELMAINLNTDLSVRGMGLVDERFLTKYDADMSAIKLHTHPVLITPGTPPTALQSTDIQQTLDQPQASSSSKVLTSKTLS